MIRSPQQEAIVDHVKRSDGSLIVEARAGSGKTTTILEAALQASDPTIMLCAFNKRIADELTARIAQHRLPRGRMIKAQTLHSLGLEIVRKHQRVDLDRDATDQIVKEVVPSAAFPVRRVIVKLVRYLKETCTEAKDVLAVTDLLLRIGYADGMEPTVIAEIVTGAIAVMEASLLPRPTLDFCDMIWQPFARNLSPRGRYKMVIVDEAQDMTLGQFFLAERLLAPGGRLIVVGDLRQEIYDWRGAAGPQIWNLLRGDGYKAKVLPLTWSFRCPKRVIQQARQLVPDITTPPDAAEGIVDTLPFSAAVRDLAVGDFFLSRTNAGAVTSAIRAQLRGATVRVLGGFEELDPLIDLIKRLDSSSPEAFAKSLHAWHTKELAKDSITDEQAERIEDRYALLIEASKLVMPKQLPATLRAVFKPSDEPAVMFSTVHKAKGLEAPRVFLLRSTFKRHRPKRDGSRWEISELPIEELNVEYVALTRAMEHLTWVVDDGLATEDEAS